MSFDIKTYKNNLLFVPLGGANEIGMNVNLYHYKGKWIMVDCGSGFPDQQKLPGADMVVADLSFISKHREDLLGIILTHAHEDHLGGVQYLWNELKCPIFATRFTKNFLTSKIAEYSFEDMDIIEINPSEKINLDPFSIEMIGLTHSAPEMQALMIRTDAGNVLHTGDWKFDPNPIIGAESEIEKLRMCGDEGVLALVCDSTNVFNSGFSGSEGDVAEKLVEIISGRKGMVIVTTFASNLARFSSIINAGQKAKRKIAIVGRSLHRMLEVAQNSGYLKDVSLIDERSIGEFKRKDVLVIATGCQGEEMAAITKIASDSHQLVKLSANDTVIFSSKIIPGNERKIFDLFNNLARKSVEVITERDELVHVSGHPNIEELEKMYQLVRPMNCIPVHGEPMHIYEHSRLAKSNNINAIEVRNGSVVLIQEEVKIVGDVESGYLIVDGNYLISKDSSIFNMRKRIGNNGIIMISIVLDKKMKLVSRVEMSMPGLFDYINDKDIINSLKDKVTNGIDDQYTRYKKLSIKQIESHVKKILRNEVKTEMNKMPPIIMNIMRINQ